MSVLGDSISHMSSQSHIGGDSELPALRATLPDLTASQSFYKKVWPVDLAWESREGVMCSIYTLDCGKSEQFLSFSFGFEKSAQQCR